MRQKKKGTTRPRQPAAKNHLPYTGLLSEHPPAVYPALFDATDPPLHAKMLFRHCETMNWREYLDRWREFVLDARKKFFEDHDRRLGLLFEHYGINGDGPDAWRKLAMGLAQTHVPAFQIECAVRKHYERRAKKGTKLDVPASVSFYLYEYLRDTSKERSLSPFEKNLKESLNKELKTHIKDETRRGLKRKMLSAERDYWNGCANDFQRQFVEKVFPLVIDLFKKIEANRVTHKP